MTESIVRLNPPSLPNSTAIGYSQISIVESGRVAYVSGQVATRPNGEAVPDDLVEQTRIVVANATAALVAIGASPRDIVIARIFVVGLGPEAMNKSFPLILSMFDGAQPCVTGIGVSALAAPNLKIEMELIVRVPD